MTPPVEPSSPQPAASTGQGVVSSGWLASQSVFGDGAQVQGRRAAGATLASIALHGLFLALVVWVIAYRPSAIVELIPPDLSKLVFVNIEGPGGGGGGSPAPAPPKPIAVPPSKPVEPVPVTPPPPPPPTAIPPPQMSAPVVTPDANLAQATGISSVSMAQYGGGGRGTGLGSGTGSGVGPGEGGGFGGGAYQPGAGINNPSLLRQVKPIYTSDAMRAKIQGTVVLDAVIKADGTVGDVRVKRSLDRANGLDQAAINAAKQWLFRPATKDGKPVDILVTLEVDFRIF